MGKIGKPDPAVLIAAIMACDVSVMEVAKERLTEMFSPLWMESPVFPCTHTSYYDKEMGSGLTKCFVCFKDLIDMSDLPRIKTATNKIEDEIGIKTDDGIKRGVNIDPGYVCLSKLVLASTKDFSHRLYIADGIFAEVTLSYVHGKFQRFEWTYPDYLTDIALDFFTKVRLGLLDRLRSGEMENS